MLFPLLVAVTLVAGCQKKASDEIDFGTTKDGLYRNQFFGFSVQIPTNWSIQDQDAQRRLAATGKNLLAGDDKNMKAILKASEVQSVDLFAAYQYAVGAAVKFDPAILSVAERVSQLPGIQRGKDYLFHARELIESGQLQATFPRADFSRRIGGVDFDAMEVDLSIRGATVREEYYAAIMKGYALAFIITYTDEAEQKNGAAILDTITFRR